MPASERPSRRRAPGRIVIVDDHDLARAGLRTMLEVERGLEIVGEASTGSQGVSLCRRLRPDLALLDVRMPDMDGLAATRLIKERCPDVRVVIVTAYEEPEFLLRALEAGADGYVLKGSPRREIVAGVRRALHGGSVLQSEVAAQLIRRLAATASAAARSDSAEAQLTTRELEVLRLVARGRTNQQIGQELILGVSTVKTHLAHILTKLRVTDRTEAAVRAGELGLLRHDDA